MSTRDPRAKAAAVSSAIADFLATPDQSRALARNGQGWWPQSLAHGAVGVALLHIELARTGCGSWQRAHDWLAVAARHSTKATSSTHLHFGAPALAFVVHAAQRAAGGYTSALDRLHAATTTVVQRRLSAATSRIDAGHLPVLAEFGAIRGLTGLGAYLLVRDPENHLLREVLSYLVRLSQPAHREGTVLPGWWTLVSPSGRPSEEMPGGHANVGMAHGIAGPLALLSLALRQGITVDGHTDAIETILSWLDDWRQDGIEGGWWPYWITRAQWLGDQPASGPGRPSWCYGTAGLARAQQLAALAIGNTTRQKWAELALVNALARPEALAAITDASLCHGYAGLAHITRRVAADAANGGLDDLADRLINRICEPDTPEHAARQLLITSGIGLLEGAAGTALALHTAATADPGCGWDAFLLIN